MLLLNMSTSDCGLPTADYLSIDHLNRSLNRRPFHLPSLYFCYAKVIQPSINENLKHDENENDKKNSSTNYGQRNDD